MLVHSSLSLTHQKFIACDKGSNKKNRLCFPDGIFLFHRKEVHFPRKRSSVSCREIEFPRRKFHFPERKHILPSGQRVLSFKDQNFSLIFFLSFLYFPDRKCKIPIQISTKFPFKSSHHFPTGVIMSVFSKMPSYRRLVLSVAS